MVLTHAAHSSHSKSFENPNAQASAVFRALRVIPKSEELEGGGEVRSFQSRGPFPGAGGTGVGMVLSDCVTLRSSSGGGRVRLELE